MTVLALMACSFLPISFSALALAGAPAYAAGIPLPADKPEALLRLNKGIYKAYRQALEFGKRNEWDRAVRLMRREGTPSDVTAIRWLSYQKPNPKHRFADIVAFLQDHPDWPARQRMFRRAEDAAVSSNDDTAVLSWFHAYPPVTGLGRLRFADALSRSGSRDLAISWVKRAWRNNDLPRKEAKVTYRRYKHALTADDHRARADNLLWYRRHAAVRGVLSLVPKPHRHVIAARLALQRDAGGVSGLIRRVPANLRNDPGLVFDRLKWRARRGLDDGVAEQFLLLDSSRAKNPEFAVGARPTAWWPPRRNHSRKLLLNGKPKKAYAVAAAHVQQPGGIGYAEAEFLAGWLALRHLKKPEMALGHFQNLYGAVRYPVSLARGSYWAGRALEAAGDMAQAETWYRRAAEHSQTFYGQLAAQRIFGHVNAGVPAALPPQPNAQRDLTLVAISEPAADQTDRTGQSIEHDPLFRIVEIIGAIAPVNALRPLVAALLERAQGTEDKIAVANLAENIGRVDFVVRSSKRLAVEISVPAFLTHPTVPLPPSSGKRDRYLDNVEPALVQALIRQESEFNPLAVSHAGARGLMQLLPRTARHIARSLRLQFHRTLLTANPDYNKTLGITYLGRLLTRFDQSYVLAAAAYNAGPTRVRSWLQKFGDPRDRDVNVIDWIESIPLTETRNYVQRVMENVTLYRQRLNVATAGTSLLDDLNRGKGT